MDFNKIFRKDACPTKAGGQAVLEGIMMKGADRTAVVVRISDGRMHIKTDKLKPQSKIAKVPIIRGVYTFIVTLISGMKTLMYSAEVLEKYDPEFQEEETEKETIANQNKTEEEKEKERAADFNKMIIFSVILSVALVVGIFIIVPTVVVNFAQSLTENDIVLNLLEGVFRILLFVIYVVIISKMKDIQTVFRYHGAEHKAIHCYESGKELTPENCDEFETLHPRCGTSFLMFVMIISLLLFSLLGWPNLLIRIASRIILVPVIAGLSFELLRFAGRSTSPLVKVLSVPGLLLQKLTTKNPNHKELEVAIASLKAVLVDENEPTIEGFCDNDGKLIKSDSESDEETEESDESDEMQAIDSQN